LLTLLWQVVHARRVQAAFDAFVLKQVATEIRNIKGEYRGVVSEESVDLIAGQSLQNLADSRVPKFVPLFVGRFTRQRLQELTGFRPRVGMRKEMRSDESIQDRRRAG
jgi:hypothetical protein